MTDKAATVCYPRFVSRILIEIFKAVTCLTLFRRAIQTHTSVRSDRPRDRPTLRLRLVMRPKASERAALFDLTTRCSTGVRSGS